MGGWDGEGREKGTKGEEGRSAVKTAPLFADASFGFELFERGIQNSIDEAAAVGCRIEAADLDRFVERDLDRYVGEFQQFGQGHPEHEPVDRGQPPEFPVSNVPGDDLIGLDAGVERSQKQHPCEFREFRIVPKRKLDQLPGHFVDFVLADFHGIEGFENLLPGLSARGFLEGSCLGGGSEGHDSKNGRWAGKRGCERADMRRADRPVIRDSFAKYGSFHQKRSCPFAKETALCVYSFFDWVLSSVG